MRKVRISAIIFVLIFAVVVSSFQGNYHDEDSFTNFDSKAQYNIDLDVDEAQVNVVATNKDQLLITYDSIKLRQANAPVYAYLKDDTLFVKQNDQKTKYIKSQINITIFIPQSFNVENVNYDGQNSSVSIEALQMQDLVISGDNVNTQINNSRVNNVTLLGHDMNYGTFSSIVNSISSKIYSGSVIIDSSTINEDVNFNFEDSGVVTFDNITANNINIEGNLKVDLNLSVTSNYQINTTEKIKTASNISQTNDGYKITGDSENEHITTIDFGDSVIDKFNFQLT